jgi:hypothetical protein
MIVAIAVVDSVTLMLLGQGCITEEEAETVLNLTLNEDKLTVKGLRNLILGLEDKALSCDKKDVALVAVGFLREAWKRLNG